MLGCYFNGSPRYPGTKGANLKERQHVKPHQANETVAIPDPHVQFAATIDEWETLAMTYASIAITAYLARAGQSVDRIPFRDTMEEIRQTAIDIALTEDGND